jgi:hypothetical protein
MMNCTTSAIIGLGLLGATFSTMSVSKEEHRKLETLFDTEIAERYSSIVKERTSIYIQGLLIGCIIAYFILRKTQITNRFYILSYFLAITLGIGAVLQLILFPDLYVYKTYLKFYMYM